MADPFTHGYPFNPSYGYSLADLRAVAAPPEPDGFDLFWRDRHQRALSVDPEPAPSKSAASHPDWTILDIRFRSTGGFELGGWLCAPKRGPVKRGLVIGHGYGGRDAPDLDFPVEDAVLLFPCLRGLSRSAKPPISTDPNWHVLHDIDDRDAYIIGGCVDDVWVSVTVLLQLYPWLDGHIGYSGISLGGGVGSFALAFDPRLTRGQIEVPTFGAQPLRLSLPSIGSAQGLQVYAADHPNVADTLTYFDAASAARHIAQPTLCAVALFDPAVAPPCQFAIANSLQNDHEIFILKAGHFDYPEAQEEHGRLRDTIGRFFGDL
ncbi:acetylxylan esterase [Rhizobium sp. TRM95796]|uniref:acetylxylan esterase n=1 Tax=Rhizobium sp. TRM95796 TaxID=2979862 RepID=UPI0021E71388|nr:acetylxylan esterase [Rhizobium sp. TRM95796]MCV3765976.1 acetylxylan esterase [Rhizobium sp. TRM95796]